jgi:hypothetical protein
VRPHDALGLATPTSRYRPSPIPFPDCLPPVEYPPGLAVRKVQDNSWFTYRGRDFRITKALRGFPIALRQAELSDSRREVLFCHQVVTLIDLNQPHHPQPRCKPILLRISPHVLLPIGAGLLGFGLTTRM